MIKPKRSKIMHGAEIAALMSLAACAPTLPPVPTVPSLEYAQRIGAGAEQDRIRGSRMQRSTAHGRYYSRQIAAQDSRARLRLVSASDGSADDVVTNLDDQNGIEPTFEMHESTAPNSRDYNGPLSLGDPGVSASLWQESRAEMDLFHDHRAWQPMDLITIIVSESSEGKKEADTDVKTESTFSAAIENFFGFENDVNEHNKDSEGNPTVDLSNLIKASTDTEFKGEGETTRKGSLKARISAMVVEVLPSGVLRIEGEKIISVNNEEQIMVLSGLVRTRDVTSQNEVDSAKVANMRIDYFGRGVVGGAQVGGWLGNFLRYVWPF